MEEEMVTISKTQYEELLDCELKLLALEDAGVDNWGYYGEAMEQYRAWKND